MNLALFVLLSFTLPINIYNTWVATRDGDPWLAVIAFIITVGSVVAMYHLVPERGEPWR